MPSLITYGTDEAAAYRMVEVKRSRASVTFTLRHEEVDLSESRCPPRACTMHARRSRACRHLAAGGEVEAAAQALARFGGVARRFEFRGEIDGVPSSTTSPISRPRSKRRLLRR